MSAPTSNTNTGVTLTDAAISKVKAFIEQEERDDLVLRLAVQPGGCSGLIYGLEFDNRTLDGDVIDEFDGVRLVVDKMSVPYLGGAVIDYSDNLLEPSFSISNPNAASTCACGGSFN